MIEHVLEHPNATLSDYGFVDGIDVYLFFDETMNDDYYDEDEREEWMCMYVCDEYESITQCMNVSGDTTWARLYNELPSSIFNINVKKTKKKHWNMQWKNGNYLTK